MSLARPKRTRFVPSLALVFPLLAVPLLMFAGPARAAERSNATVVGEPHTGSAGVPRSTREIMQEQARSAGKPEPILLGNEFEFDKGDARQNPASPRVASIPSMPVDQMIYRGSAARQSSGQKLLPYTPQTLGVNFTAATLSGTNSTGSFPPDNDGAVGPTQYVVAVNGRIVTFNKTTGVADGVLNTTTNTFFSTVRNAFGTSDPMVRYDRLSNRWFMTIINVSMPNRWLLAVSDAASNGVISGATVWAYYFIIPATQAPAISNGSSILSDYPTLAIDANALYVGVDEFVASTGAFQQTDVFVVRKTSVLSGGPIVVTMFRALMTATGGYVGPYAPRGADNPDPSSNEGYFVSPDGASWGTMWIHRIATPGGTPSITGTSITLPAENVSRPVVHPGNTGGFWGYLDNLDDRYFQATIRGQQLWTCHNIDVDNTGVSQGTFAGDTRSAARWFQLNVPVNTGTPTIVQMGTVFTASAGNDTLQKQYLVPSLTVSGQGHVAMGFSTAGASAFVNCGTVGRLAGDPLGTMETPVQITNNTSSTYNPMSDPGGASAGRPRRWGDYTQTTLDPIDDMTMWTVQQFVDATNSYGVRVAKLIAPPPATPSAMADVNTGLASVNITLTGVSSAGSGFYDPGPDLSAPARPFNHLSAAVSNGSATGTPPTVVSVTYLNPTTINVVLNTTSATANLSGEKYTITVTNPDGQTAAGAVVHVVNQTITASAGSGGSISPSGAVSVPQGAHQAFTITANPCFSIASVIVDGSSVGAVSSYTFHNVTANHTISASFAPGLTNAVTGLTAAQVKTGNPSGSTTGIQINYTVPLGSTSVEVWRKGFGSYPLYGTAPGTGTVPALPGSYPPAGWTKAVGVTASGQVDSPGTRDYWYYVAFGKDACGNASPVSAVTGGTLDYHLGDISNGITAGVGDNMVSTADASLLGAHYGATGGALAGFEFLDAGPTTDNTTNGRPTVDGTADFEDLVMVALNFTPNVSRPGTAHPFGVARKVIAGDNVLSLRAPVVANVDAGFDVPVILSGNGELQAISLSLGWNPEVVQPLSVTPGDLVMSKGGVVLSPGPGRADAAILGAGSDVMDGQGEVATIHFRVLRSGEPNVSIASAVGRNSSNKNVSIVVQNPLGVSTPALKTALFPVIPNPSRGTSLVTYSLAQGGPVSLAVYSIDGRLVKSLMHEVQGAGRHQYMWDGTDERGSAISSGMFYIRLEAAGVLKTRVVSVIR